MLLCFPRKYHSEDDDYAPVDYTYVASIAEGKRREQGAAIHREPERAGVRHRADPTVRDEWREPAARGARGDDASRRIPRAGDPAPVTRIAYPRPRDNAFAHTPPYADDPPAAEAARDPWRDMTGTQPSSPPPTRPGAHTSPPGNRAPELAPLATPEREFPEDAPEWLRMARQNNLPFQDEHRRANRQVRAPEAEPLAPRTDLLGRPILRREPPQTQSPTPVRPEDYEAAGYPPELIEKLREEDRRAAQELGYHRKRHGAQLAAPPNRQPGRAVPPPLLSRAEQEVSSPLPRAARRGYAVPAAFPLPQDDAGWPDDPHAVDGGTDRFADPDRAQETFAPPVRAGMPGEAYAYAPPGPGAAGRNRGADAPYGAYARYGAASEPEPTADYTRRPKAVDPEAYSPQAYPETEYPQQGYEQPDDPAGGYMRQGYVPQPYPQGGYAPNGSAGREGRAPTRRPANPYAGQRQIAQDDFSQGSLPDEEERPPLQVPWLGIATFAAAALLVLLWILQSGFNTQTAAVLADREAARIQLQNSHPYGYRELIEREAQANNLHPAFVAAIVLNESSFNPNAESRVGARGLMQMMPDTAQWVFEKMGDTGEYTFDWMYDPDRNVRYACWYLAYLSDRFHGDPVLVSAAFHAGQTTVQNWLNDSRYSLDSQSIDLDRMAEGPTKTYATRVLKAFATYRRLYYEDGLTVADGSAAAQTSADTPRTDGAGTPAA